MINKVLLSKKVSDTIKTALVACLVLVGGLVTFSMVKGVSSAQAALPTTPSQVFDLSYWKLTLPINDAQEIKQPQLDSYSSQYFKINTAKNAITFMSPAGGETTGKSSYARSELRERRMPNNEYSFTADCTELRKPSEACWSTSIGYHIMTIDQTITHIPSEKPHVVVGQIHDEKDDNFVFRLEEKKLFVDANRYKSLIGNNGEILITNNYQLGTRFTVAFEVVNDETVFYYNGQRVGSIPVKYKNGYFKAGMYVQSNEGGGEYGQVDIHNVKVCHAASKGECSAVKPAPPGDSNPITPAPTAVVTQKPTATPTPRPGIPTPTPTRVPVVTSTPAPTKTPTPTRVPVVTSTPSPTKTPTPTRVPVITSTPAPTKTPTPVSPVTGKIAGIKATSPKDSKVIVDWASYPGVKEYRVFMAQDSASKLKQEDETKSTSINFNLKSCKTYYFRVDGYDSKGKLIAVSDITNVLVSIGSPVRACK